MLECQGAKKHHLRQEIKILNWNIRPDILILLEIVANKENLGHIISALGYDNFDYMLPENHYGWIWVIWNNDSICSQVIIKETQATHLLIHDSIGRNIFEVLQLLKWCVDLKLQ